MWDKPSYEGTASLACMRQRLLSQMFVWLAAGAVGCSGICRSVLRISRLVESGLVCFWCLVVLLGSLMKENACAFQWRLVF